MNTDVKKALFKGRDWITTQEWTEAELDVLLDVSSDLKRKFKGRVPHRYLADQTIFLMFFDKSTRTRNSFEAGMTQLGGHAHFLTADVMQVSHGESPKDTGIILSSYGHAIAIRHDLVPGEGNAYMREVAKWADAPVINMQCDVDHPCQTIADLMTIREQRGRNLRGLMRRQWHLLRERIPSGLASHHCGRNRPRVPFLAVAVLLVTHEARHAGWADRVVFLRDGRISDTAVYTLDAAVTSGPRRSTSGSPPTGGRRPNG